MRRRRRLAVASLRLPVIDSARPTPPPRRFRPVACSARRPFPALAVCAARHAIAAGAARCDRDLRRPPRPAGQPDEPGRRAAVDSLARPVDPGTAGGRQRLLHGVPVHAAAHARPALAARRPAMAALAAQQMAGGRSARTVPVELRGVRPVGQPVVDGLDCDRLLRGGLRRRRLVSAARRSASTSARSASSTSCSRWSRRWK